MPKSFKKNLEVSVNLKEFTPENGNLEIYAYVFTRSGRLLEKQKIALNKEDLSRGKVNFNLNVKDENVVVKLGPDVEEPTDLVKHSSMVEGIILKDEKSALVFDIEKEFWNPWFRKPYCIRGNVVKLEGGGELPISYGEVDIYDVDIGFIWRLRDDIIERLRDALIDVITNPPPVIDFPRPDEIYKPSWWKDDYCGTPTGPRPPKGLEINIGKVLEELPQEWGFSRERYEKLPNVKSSISRKIESMIPDEKVKWLDSEVLEGVKMSSLVFTNTMQFKKILVDKFQSFRYWLCWFPWIYWIWWPHFWYSLEKLGTAKIKQDGSFSKLIWLPVRRRDIPDLWFVVRQNINGVDRVIYARHPVPCNTYWNHPSCDPVKLYVTDPAAIAYHKEHDITDDSGLWLCPLAIGNYSLKNIYGTGADVGIISSSDFRIGRYKQITTGLGGTLGTFNDGPFGGFIGIRILFSSGLLDNNIKYYKIKYRSNGTGDWFTANHEVKRHYSHYNSTKKTLELLPYHIGPQSLGDVNNLFEIRPKYPPNKATEPDADWYVFDATVDLMSSYIDTSKLPNGNVEIKLEIYDKNGIRVNPPAFDTGIQFKLPSNTDIWSTIILENAADVNPDLVKADPENNAYQAFIFKLQIDNRTPTAIIDPPVVLTSGNITTDCGITHYENSDTNVRLSYQARHPNRFAMYSFKVIRSAEAIITQTGQAGDMGLSGNFEITPYIRPNILLPLQQHLLKECHDDAAFSMNLYLWNMAFNGWSRVGADASAVRAFALVPNR